jgi:hypothetical protein
MKLTKERKIYVGLFVLAAAAFVGDQLFSGPSHPEASAEAALVVPAAARTAAIASISTAKERASASLEQGGSSLRLAEKLAAVDREQALSTTELSDPFQTAKSWDAPQVSSDNRPAAFAQRHKLTAVMVSSARNGGESAIIDGELVRVGQSLDGFRLIEVSTRSAVFECNKQLARLALADN